MKVIGITGGVGAGKTQILSYLAGHTRSRIIMADQVAHELEEPEGCCYEPILSVLGTEILAEDGRIDRPKMAAQIFADEGLLQQINGIVHPAVKAYITEAIETERERRQIDYLFVEAALLIEDGYEKIVDELWYIHADEQVRRERLKEARGYSDEKIDSIMQGQLSEEEFYEHCSVVIDNSGAPDSAYRQIDKKLGEYLCQRQ